MKKNQKVWMVLIFIGLVLFIWAPVFLNWYDYVTALFIFFGTIIGGWVGGKFLRYNQENK